MIDIKLQKEAEMFIKNNMQLFYERFTDKKIFLPVQDPYSIFMAGSPGAGKTEFSTSFDLSALHLDFDVPLVRIDPDEIKKMIPQYDGKNTDCVQKAATIVADKLFDFVQKHHQNVIVDTTFADFHKAEQNIKRAVKRKRSVAIIYLHQNPIVAWKFTKIRELEEGRPIPKSFFISSYFGAKENVNKIKEMYGKMVKIIFVEKDFTNHIAKTYINIDKIDYHIKLKYNREQLEKLLTEPISSKV